MAKNNSKEFFNRDRATDDYYRRTVDCLYNKYYNIYRSNFKTTGLDYRQEYYLMNKFWQDGTIAAFSLKHNAGIAFAPWQMVSWDLYNQPETITLINTYSSPLVPTDIKTVDKEVVIGYLQSNRKPLKKIVSWYIERIAQVEAVINTNLNLNKMPFLVRVDEDNRKKVEDVVDRILNNELVITVDGDPGAIEAITTAAPYIIDKLQDYKKTLENDLLTYLGIQNCNTAKQEQLQMAEVNGNNEEINLSDTDFENNLKDFCKRVKEVLGFDISITVSQPDAEADGQEHKLENKTGPKSEGETEDDK